MDHGEASVRAARDEELARRGLGRRADGVAADAHDHLPHVVERRGRPLLKDRDVAGGAGDQDVMGGAIDGDGPSQAAPVQDREWGKGGPQMDRVEHEHVRTAGIADVDTVGCRIHRNEDRRHRRRHRRVDVVDLDQVGTEHRDEEPTSGRVDSHAIRLLLRRQHRLPVIGLARLIERPRLEVEAVGVDIKQPMRRLVDRHT